MKMIFCDNDKKTVLLEGWMYSNENDEGQHGIWQVPFRLAPKSAPDDAYFDYGAAVLVRRSQLTSK